ncbi:MAG: glycosyltransferase family 4 protein [Planctomycetota bacterium]
MTPRRILYVHHASVLGGAPRSLAFLIKQLDKERFTPIVLMPKRPINGDVRKLFSDAGATVVEERHIRPFGGAYPAECKTIAKRAYALLSAIPTMLAVRKHVRQLDPDIVHVNTVVLPFALVGSFLGRRRTPRVTHIREVVLSNWWGRSLAALNRWFTDFFIGIDGTGLDSVGAVDAKRETVMNSVNLDDYRSSEQQRLEARREFGWSDDRVVFLSLSRIAPSNGIEELSDLVASCKDELSQRAMFAVAGFGNDVTGYEDTIRDRLDSLPNCQTLPFSSDVIRLISASDVIIAPFVTSHSARSVLEGAAVGRPAMVSNVPNLTEMIRPEESGFIFSLDSREQFVLTVNRFCDDERREIMSRQALKVAEERFNIADNTKRIEQIYFDLLGDDPTHDQTGSGA